MVVSLGDPHGIQYSQAQEFETTTVGLWKAQVKV